MMTGGLVLVLVLVLASSAVFTVVAEFQVDDGCVVRNSLEVQMVGLALTFTLREPLDPGLNMTLQRPGQDPFPLDLNTASDDQREVRWSPAALDLLPVLQLTLGGRTVLKMDETFNAPPKLVIDNAEIMTNCPNEGRPIHVLARSRRSLKVPLTDGAEVGLLGLFTVPTMVHLTLASKFTLAWDGMNVKVNKSGNWDSYKSRSGRLALNFTLSDQGYQIKWKGQTVLDRTWTKGPVKELEVSITRSKRVNDTFLFVDTPLAPAPDPAHVTTTTLAPAQVTTTTPTSATTTLAPAPLPKPESSSEVSLEVVVLMAILILTVFLLVVCIVVIYVMCRRRGGSDLVSKQEDEKKSSWVTKEGEGEGEGEEEAPAPPPRPAHHRVGEREATPARPPRPHEQEQKVELAPSYPPNYIPYEYEGEGEGEAHPPLYDNYQYEQQQYPGEQYLEQQHRGEEEQQQPWTETPLPTKEESDYITPEQVRPFVVEMMKKENLFSGDINYHDEAPLPELYQRKNSEPPVRCEKEARFVTRQYSDGACNYGASNQQGYPQQGGPGYNYTLGQSSRDEMNYEEDDYMEILPQQHQGAIHGQPK